MKIDQKFKHSVQTRLPLQCVGGTPKFTGNNNLVIAVMPHHPPSMPGPSNSQPFLQNKVHLWANQGFAVDSGIHSGVSSGVSQHSTNFMHIHMSLIAYFALAWLIMQYPIHMIGNRTFICVFITIFIRNTN